MPLKIELKLYRSLWKLTFRLDDDNCKKNRVINAHILWILTKRHPSEIYELISEGKYYYSNVSTLTDITIALIMYLSKAGRRFFLLLSQITQIIIRETCKKNDFCRLYGNFIYDNLTDYCQVVFNYMNTNTSFIINTLQWENIFIFSDST